MAGEPKLQPGLAYEYFGSPALERLGDLLGSGEALAIENATTPAAVDLNELHELLRQHNAIVPG